MSTSKFNEEMCSCCAGTGNPISGLPCICGGVGTAWAETNGLRLALYQAHSKLEATNHTYMEAMARIFVLEKALRNVMEPGPITFDHCRYCGADDFEDHTYICSVCPGLPSEHEHKREDCKWVQALVVLNKE